MEIPKIEAISPVLLTHDLRIILRGLLHELFPTQALTIYPDEDCTGFFIPGLLSGSTFSLDNPEIANNVDTVSVTLPGTGSAEDPVNHFLPVCLLSRWYVLNVRVRSRLGSGQAQAYAELLRCEDNTVESARKLTVAFADNAVEDALKTLYARTPVALRLSLLDKLVDALHTDTEIPASRLSTRLLNLAPKIA